MEEISFKVGEVNYKVRQPNLDEQNKAQMVYNKAFSMALNSGLSLRGDVADVLRARGAWNDEKQEELEKTQKDISDKEYALHKGGIYKKEARQIAIDLKKLRNKLSGLFAPIANFNQYTCEGQAENARFDSLVSSCTVYEDGRPVFASLEDYKNRGNDAVAILGSTKFAELHYLLGQDDLGSGLPENQFLKEHGFADDKFRLIDSKGRLITEDGRLINEDGNLLDEDGDLVDILGHKLDKDGNFTVERKPFLDEADSEQDSATTE